MNVTQMAQMLEFSQKGDERGYLVKKQSVRQFRKQMYIYLQEYLVISIRFM